MTADTLAWFAVCMLCVIAYGCARMSNGALRLFASDAMFLACDARPLSLHPLCMVWPAARGLSLDAPLLTIRDSAA
jgi:hypothetical protein